MKILAVSDVEVAKLRDDFSPELFAGVDLIFSCGDLAPEYLTLIREKVDAPLYYILGNHDLRYGQSPPVGCTDISFTTACHEGIKLLGLSGSRWYNGGPNQYHETEMRMIIWKLYFALWRQQGVDFVVAHAPPRHIHDAEDRCHRGFKFFHNLINRFQPLYFLHGHIHAAFDDDRERITMAGTTQVINCCGMYVFETGNI
jgi:Icc-related predicted phosphoesterase